MNSAANGDRPAPSGPVISRRMVAAASGEARSVLNSPSTCGRYCPTSSQSCAQAAPSPGASRSASAMFAARSVVRTAVRPPGIETPVGIPLFAKARPRSASSGPRSA